MVQSRFTRTARIVAVERACPAAKLPEADRINLAILALAGTATITGLAVEHDVSRKFVYQQANKASATLTGVFSSGAANNEVLFDRNLITHMKVIRSSVLSQKARF